MSYDYGMYAGWTAKDLLTGKGSAPSPFPGGAVPADWDWQNFLNYGGDGQARELIESGRAIPKEPQPEPEPQPKAKPKKAAKAKLPKWSAAKPIKPPKKKKAKAKHK